MLMLRSYIKSYPIQLSAKVKQYNINLFFTQSHTIFGYKQEIYIDHPLGSYNVCRLIYKIHFLTNSGHCFYTNYEDNRDLMQLYL